MSAKANFFKIGVFVLMGIALIVAVVIIFGAGLLTKENVYFETYFDSSVYGLNIGSPVLLRGVKMGEVTQITFARNLYNLPKGTPEIAFEYSNYVAIVCSVEKQNLPDLTTAERKTNVQALVDRGLRLRLSTNILTGQGILEAEMLDPNRFPVGKVPWEPKNPYIPSAPGAFSTMKDSVDRILAKLEEVDVGRIGDKIEEFIDSLDQAVTDANVGQVSTEAKGLLADARTKINNIDTEKMNEQIKQLLASLDEAVDDANVPELAARLSSSIERVDELVASGRPDIEDLLANFKKISADLRELSENLKQNPSQIIFSKPPPEPEALK